MYLYRHSHRGRVQRSILRPSTPATRLQKNMIMPMMPLVRPITSVAFMVVVVVVVILMAVVMMLMLVVVVWRYDSWCLVLDADD